MPNQIGLPLEHRIPRLSLGHPGHRAPPHLGRAEREKWGGLVISENRVWCVLKRFNLNTRSKCLALIARHADPYERKPEIPSKELHIDASEPDEKVQMNCFYLGRLAGCKGVIWQYTKIDVASAYTWPFLHSSDHNPPPVIQLSWSTRSQRPQGGGLEAPRGHHRQTVRRRGADFGKALAEHEATQRKIKARGRTQTAARSGSS
jgi:hypothetical protein